MAKTTKLTLDEMLALRLDLMEEREQMRERLGLLTNQIDAAMEEQRGIDLLTALSPRDRELVAQTIRARGIESKETVNG